MLRFLIVALSIAMSSRTAAATGGGPAFERYFAPKALRVDLYHSGNAEREIYSLDEVRLQPVWAGNPRNLIDTLNLGGCFMRVFDVKTNALIFARGYSTLYDEWKTTDEAIAGFNRTFHESLIIPFPKEPVQVRIESRDKKNIFRPAFDLVIDPADYHIGTEQRFTSFKVLELMGNGPPADKVDIAILGDGYDRDEMHKLRADAERLLRVLFDTEPFKSRKRDFNVRLVESISEASGVTEPREHMYPSSLLGCSFNTFDIPRYMLSFSNKVMREVAANVPYDIVIVIANAKRYGGGGIFNLYSISCSDNEFSGYVFTHEFGHAFAGLGDEYYSSEVAYNDMYPKGMEPWEPNITALLDTAKVKWRDLIRAGTPIPTPNDSTYAGIVGCFEGAGYSAKGLFRPSRDCIMLSKKEQPFCPVCRRAIEKVIDSYTK
jgi:hypothetical protein